MSHHLSFLVRAASVSSSIACGQVERHNARSAFSLMVSFKDTWLLLAADLAD